MGPTEVSKRFGMPSFFSIPFITTDLIQVTHASFLSQYEQLENWVPEYECCGHPIF